MVVDQAGQGCVQARGLQGFTRGQQQRLVPMLARRDHLLEKAVLHGREDHLAADRALIDHRRLFKARHQRQAAHALVLEQVTRAEANPRLAGAADHLDRDNRIATQLKEVVVQTDLRSAEHIAPDRCQGLLQFAFGRDKGLLRCSIRQRQRLAVELAVGGDRQFGQGDEMRGHHVFRQAAEQPDLEVGRLFTFVNQIGNQLFAALHQYHGFAHLRVLHQPGFDFAQLDTQTAQLDLMVEAAEVLDHAIGTLAHAVAGAVEALAANKRAGHKALGGQAGTAVITARKADTAQVQLARDTGGHRVELGVEHIGGQVGNWAADGHAVGAFVHACPVGNVDGGFGGAVEVEQTRRWQFGEHLQLRIQWQGFAAAHNAF
ncbi:hypothetical protein [Pseudomonas sp. 58 R 3]|nr:hypothetical protein [Pseudomonas sp. 58 R 3]